MKAQSIVCIGQTPWKGDFQRPAVQLLTELAQHYRSFTWITNTRPKML